jgi:HAD superfamily hydrolase (TIGR01450 family)
MVEKLSEMGLEVEEKEIYCGSYMLSQYIKKNYPKKSVYVVGEVGLLEEFEREGIECVEEGAEVVVAGLDRHFTYDKLQKAHTQIRNGAAFVASNKDHIYPTESGPKPGCGSIVSAIEYSSEKKAYTLGKPSRYAFDLISDDYQINRKETYMVGDRLDTDIMFAKNCGIKSILVLTGNAKKEDIKDVKPDFVFESIRNISREEKL